MPPTIRLERDGPLAILLVENPPVNALSRAVRQALPPALAAALRDPEVRAVILAAVGRTFVSGADLREMDGPRPRPGTADLAALLEVAPVPVVAALHGSVLGGGLELALGCHFRIADPAARFGLPEVTLGILPAAGGAQRLPRLVGVTTALEMILHGQPIDAAAALAIGLVDRVAAGPLLDAARCFAQMLIRTATSLRRLSRQRAEDPAGSLAEWRAALHGRFRAEPALEACLTAVEGACTLPFDVALAADEEAFLALRATPRAKALRHAFLTERAVRRLADGP